MGLEGTLSLLGGLYQGFSGSESFSRGSGTSLVSAKPPVPLLPSVTTNHFSRVHPIEVPPRTPTSYLQTGLLRIPSEKEGMATWGGVPVVPYTLPQTFVHFSCERTHEKEGRFYFDDANLRRDPVHVTIR